MTRLLDIEESHRDMLRWGLAEGADWILVLEDDAMSPDVDDCARGLRGIMEGPDERPAYVNVSHSFSPSQLGINHLLRPADGTRWQGGAERVIYASDLPVTNTVCAILYRAGFAAQLLSVLGRLPSEPIVPIDWKLNEALMALHDEDQTPPGSCWLVEPAPIVQMSMR